MTTGIFQIVNRESRYRFRRLLLGVLLIAPVLVSAFAGAARSADNSDGDLVLPDRFTQHNWSQIVPNHDYLEGCVTAYRAFQFNPLGYFIFDRRIHGTWRVDSRGNLVLQTRDGIRFTLIYDGHDTLISPHSNKIKFLGPIDRYRECRE